MTNPYVFQRNVPDRPLYNFMQQNYAAARSAHEKWEELKAMRGQEVPGVPGTLTFHVENDDTPLEFRTPEPWVNPLNLRGVDRPMIRRRNNRWVIYYGYRKFFLYEDMEHKHAYLFAMWMTQGFWS